ncbi:MAG: AraC family transcriptional regulator [Clostridia bacterium]|nr:AraC family transcriptional regulator [Clostridia bacterium]
MPYKVPDIFVSQDNTDPYLCFVQAGSEQCAPSYCYGPAVRDFYLIHFISSGSGEYQIGEMTYSVDIGEAFIVYPGEAVTYKADKRYPWSYSFIGLRGSMVESLIERTAFAGHKYVARVRNPDIFDVINEIANEINANEDMPNKDLFALERAIRVMRVLIDESGDSQKEVHVLNSYVAKAIEYIQEHYAEDMNIGSIAESLNINRSYFFRLFKDETGLAPIQYLSRYRVMIARKLLIETETPVSEISLACGFTTPSAFYRMFNIEYGTSPSRYRKLYRKHTKGLPG